MPGDNLMIHHRTVRVRTTREKTTEEEKNREEEGRGSKCSGGLDRLYNLGKKRGRESYEFKN